MSNFIFQKSLHPTVYSTVQREQGGGRDHFHDCKLMDGDEKCGAVSSGGGHLMDRESSCRYVLIA